MDGWLTGCGEDAENNGGLLPLRSRTGKRVGVGGVGTVVGVQPRPRSPCTEC
jgi:hypothetical protein